MREEVREHSETLEQDTTKSGQEMPRARRRFVVPGQLSLAAAAGVVFAATVLTAWSTPYYDGEHACLVGPSDADGTNGCMAVCRTMNEGYFGFDCGTAPQSSNCACT